MGVPAVVSKPDKQVMIQVPCWQHFRPGTEFFPHKYQGGEAPEVHMVTGEQAAWLLESLSESGGSDNSVCVLDMVEWGTRFKSGE